MFEQGHMQYQFDRNVAKEPSPTDFVGKAIKILQKNDKGFFLLVEGISKYMRMIYCDFLFTTYFIFF